MFQYIELLLCDNYIDGQNAEELQQLHIKLITGIVVDDDLPGMRNYRHHY